MLEEQTPPIDVVMVTATDVDLNENGRVTYSLVNSSLLPFSIDAGTGQVQTRGVLDRETIPSYTLIVLAKDQVSDFLFFFLTIYFPDVCIKYFKRSELKLLRVNLLSCIMHHWLFYKYTGIHYSDTLIFVTLNSKRESE